MDKDITQLQSLLKYKDIINTLNVLIADDDVTQLIILNSYLNIGFNEIAMAKNGMEALDILKTSKIDLIITDNIMPIMTGLDMIRELKNINEKIPPVILISGFIDTDYLIDCINLGITQFLVKPITRENLYNAIEFSIKNVIVERLNNLLRDKEIELLKLKEQNTLLQNELALKKEKNIIINDNFLKKIESKNTWTIDVQSRSYDTLSGDIYSIRNLSQNKVCLALFDGMGKGISAAISTILSVSYFNSYINNKLKHKEDLSLNGIINSVFNFIKDNILDDEILSATFVLFDFENELLFYSIFGNPSIYIKKEDGSIFSYKSNNMPISKYIVNTILKIDMISLNDVNSILITSDGINEAPIGDNLLYQNFIKEDFKNSIFLKDFMASFYKRIRDIDDDLTCFYLNKIDFKPKEIHNYVIKARLKEIIEVSKNIEDFLVEKLKNDTINDDFINTYLTVFTELLMNAFEHGSLNIDINKKNAMIFNYESYIQELEKEVDKKIFINLLFHELNHRIIFQTQIIDEGSGFNTNIMKDTILENKVSSHGGRGIYISKRITDLLYYNIKGNEVSFYFILN